jgi:hypothetical protein
MALVIVSGTSTVRAYHLSSIHHEWHYYPEAEHRKMLHKSYKRAVWGDFPDDVASDEEDESRP